MKVLISQMKPYLGDVEKNLKKMLEITKRAIDEKCSVVVFPELALNGTLLEDIVFDVGISEVPEKLLEFSHEITIIFGAVETEKGKLYNSGYCIEDGEIVGKHRKIFLSNSFGGSESRYFTRGKEIKTFESKYGTFAITLGEEGMNPMVNGILGADGAEVVFNLVNEGAVVKSENLSCETLAVSSSLYNKNFNVVVNRCGVEDGVIFVGGSFVVSPYGKVIDRMDRFEEGFCIADLDMGDLRKAFYNSCLDKESNLEIIKKELERVINK